MAATAKISGRRARLPGRAVRLIGAGVTGLGEPVRQMSLWEQPSEKQRKLQSTLDELQERFGERVIRRGKNRNAS